MFKRFLYIILSVALFVELALILSSTWWVFELFTHYIPYYVGIGAFFFLLSLIRIKAKKQWILAGTFLLLTGINLAMLIPYYLPPTNKVLADNSLEGSRQELTLLTQNFYMDNDNLQGLSEMINSEDPDLFLIVETPNEWTLAQLYPYFEEYPYLYLNTANGPDGFFVGSKGDAKMQAIEINGRLSVLVEIELKKDEGQILSILGVHPVPPVSKEFAQQRNDYFEALAQWTNEQKNPIVVMGDFNTAPWSPHFKNLIKTSSLRDSRLGQGLLTTWNAKNMLLYVPIDYILLSDSVNLISLKKVEKVGSDHEGLRAEIEW